MAVDPATPRAHEEGAAVDAARDRPTGARAADWVAAHMDAAQGPALDVGCGPGAHLHSLPPAAIGLDPAAAMVTLARGAVPGARLIQGEAAALPFRDRTLAGAVGASYARVERTDLPMVLAELHRVLRVDAPAALVMFGDDQEPTGTDGGDLPDHRFSRWEPGALRRVLEGAGFAVERLDERATARRPDLEVRVRRRRSLPDTVGAGMRLLVCGLNPSLHAADMGVGFGRPGNRFWPAALAADLVTVDRDPRHALHVHGIGMTDLVKRATPRADALTGEEYEAGVDRLTHLCRWLRPAAVCMVGLAGWRVAVDRRATAGWQDVDLGGSPVYLMPSTSGLNAHARLPDLTAHLRAAVRGPGR